jgi:hypothetical protein
MAVEFGNMGGVVIFCIIAIVAFIFFGVNKSNQNDLRRKYTTIDAVKEEKVPNSTATKLVGLPSTLSIKDYENYKKTWEATWMWIGIVAILIALLFMFVK